MTVTFDTLVRDFPPNLDDLRNESIEVLTCDHFKIETRLNVALGFRYGCDRVGEVSRTFPRTLVRIALDDVSWHGHRRTIELVGSRGALRSAHNSRYSVRVDYQGLRRLPRSGAQPTVIARPDSFVAGIDYLGRGPWFDGHRSSPGRWDGGS